MKLKIILGVIFAIMVTVIPVSIYASIPILEPPKNQTGLDVRGLQAIL